MDKTLQKDIFEWDVVNWSKATPFWESKTELDTKPLKCLEIGAKHGGLSLWLALKGHEVVCTDLNDPEKIAKPIHDKYDNITIRYEAMNALEIPYENEFDIVIFKSILGGISRGGNDEFKAKAIQQMHKALKPSGKLLFAENLEASKIHQFFRKKFVSWGKEWNYLNINEVDALFSDFSNVVYHSLDFFGAFGPNEKNRNLFGQLDTLIDSIFKKQFHYILIACAEK